MAKIDHLPTTVTVTIEEGIGHANVALLISPEEQIVLNVVSLSLWKINSKRVIGFAPVDTKILPEEPIAKNVICQRICPLKRKTIIVSINKKKKTNKKNFFSLFIKKKKKKKLFKKKYKKKKDLPSNIRYLIVLDFEATCDEPTNPDPQEIIEFPSVLVDVKKKQIVSSIQCKKNLYFLFFIFYLKIFIFLFFYFYFFQFMSSLSFILTFPLFVQN